MLHVVGPPCMEGWRWGGPFGPQSLWRGKPRLPQEAGWAEPGHGCLLNPNPGSGTDSLHNHVSQFPHLQTPTHLSRMPPGADGFLAGEIQWSCAHRSLLQPSFPSTAAPLLGQRCRVPPPRSSPDFSCAVFPLGREFGEKERPG